MAVLNSSKPTTGSVIAGVYNLQAPQPVDGQALPIQLDNQGNSWISIAGNGGLGTATLPLRIDPTGTTVQPVSGTVNVQPISRTPSSPTANTVGVTSALALASNLNRQGLVLVNTSQSIISIAFGVAAVLSSGITLMANGGSWEMDQFTFYTGAVYAIASAASSNLSIQEFST